MAHVPDAVWVAVAALLGAVTQWLVAKARAERRSRILRDEVSSPFSESLRRFVDARAEHKVNNAINTHVTPLRQRVDAVERAIATHADQAIENAREFGELKTEVRSVSASMATVQQDVKKLIGMVGQLQGKTDSGPHAVASE